jgi:hypothetical protein
LRGGFRLKELSNHNLTVNLYQEYVYQQRSKRWNREQPQMVQDIDIEISTKKENGKSYPCPQQYYAAGHIQIEENQFPVGHTPHRHYPPSNRNLLSLFFYFTFFGLYKELSFARRPLQGVPS